MAKIQNQNESKISPADFFSSFHEDPVVETPSAGVETNNNLPPTGGSLRERRARAVQNAPHTEFAVPVAPAIVAESTPQAPIEVNDISQAVDTAAERGLELAMPKADGLVQGGVAEIGSDGEIVKKGNLVDAANLGEKELAPGSGDIANILATKEPVKANEGIAKKAFSDIKPELPVVVVKSVQNNAKLEKPVEKFEPPKPGAAAMPEAKVPGIVFAGDSQGGKDAIQRIVEEHASNGTAEKDKPDALAPIITEGLAEKTAPVVDEVEVLNAADKTVLENQDALVDGKAMQKIPSPEVVVPATEPHPFVADESSELPPEAEDNNVAALDKLLANPNIPLDGQSSRVQAVEAKPLAEKPVVPQAPDLELLSGDQMPSGEKPIEQSAPIQEQASTGAEQEDTTKQEFWAQNAASVQAPADNQTQVAPPQQGETAKAAKGFWGWLLGGEKHPVHNIAYAKNSHGLTAKQVNEGVGQSQGDQTQEEPTIAQAA